MVLYRKTELFRKMIFHLHIAAELLTSTGHPLNGLAVLKALVHLYDGTANLASEPSYAALVSQASAFPGAAEGGEGDSSAPHSARPRSGTDQVPGLPGNQAVSAKETVLLVWPRLQISLLQELIRLCDQLDGTAVFWRTPHIAALLRSSSSLFFLALLRSSSSFFFLALLRSSSSLFFFALLLRSSSSLFFALLRY